MRKALLTLALLLALAPIAAAATAPKDLPKSTDCVSDFAHVLSPAAIKKIDRICALLDHSKPGTQLAVVTIPSLDGADIADYARDLANTWGVGNKATNRGALLLLAIQDHKWRIAVGYGLESTLTNPRTQKIGDTMIPRLRKGDFDGAVLLAVQKIVQAVSGHKASAQEPRE
ncbi:MAG TPA: TPM domain-containing protein [Terracidiphilus sp.]|jgi:uncharacterized protein|nr:TPM domain-containing protein [Terracidiphilus sp.]